MPETHRTGFEDRIGQVERTSARLEAELLGLTRSVSSLAESVHSLGTQVRQEIGALATQVSASQRPNYSALGVVLSIFALVAGVLGYALREQKIETDKIADAFIAHAQSPGHQASLQKQEGTIAQVLENQSNIAKINDTMAQHLEGEGHLATLQRVTALEERVGVLSSTLQTSVKDLDETLQREMRLVNGETATRVDALDKKLQQEIAAAEKAVLLRFDPVLESVHRLNEWSSEHENYASGKSASLEARMTALERVAFKEDQ